MNWIKCSERLPELYQPVLFTGGLETYAGQRAEKCGEIIWMETIHDNWLSGSSITHWAELPSPPQAGD